MRALHMTCILKDSSFSLSVSKYSEWKMQPSEDYDSTWSETVQQNSDAVGITWGVCKR